MTNLLEANKNLKNEIEYSDSGVQTKDIFRIDAVSGKLLALKKGQKIPNHQTKIQAILVVLEGEAKFSLGLGSFHLKAGDVFSIPILEMHELLAIENFKAILIR